MRILLDTDEAAHTSAVLLGAPGEYGGIGRRLLASGTIGMPPQVAAHVLGELVHVESVLVRLALELECQGIVLRRRASLLAADDGFAVSGEYAWSTLAGWLSATITGSAGARLTANGLTAWAEGHLFAGVRGGRGWATGWGAFGLAGDISGYAGLSADAQRRLQIGRSGIDASASTEARIGAGGSVHSRMGLDRAYVDDRASAFVGARAGAGGEFVVRPTRVAGTVHAEAFAGAEASIEQENRLGGVSTKGGAGVAWGVGGAISEGHDISLEKVSFESRGKIAFGPGISYHVGVEVRPIEVAHDVQGIGHAIGDGADNAGRAVGRGADTVGRNVGNAVARFWH